MSFSMIRRYWPIATVLLAVLAAPWRPSVGSGPASRAAETQPRDDLDYWLDQARKSDRPPAEATRDAPASRPAGQPAGREDALPGVVELSDGSVIAGWMYTTREKHWEVYLDNQKRWQQVPFLAVLSIRAVVKEENFELRWRWKAMGQPEKVYTGAKYPFRRLEWQVRLIDGESITGAIKGQPLHVHPAGGGEKRVLVLQERQKGNDGQGLKDLVYVRRVIVSRRLMDAVVADATQGRKATSGAGQDSSTRPAKP